MDAEFLSRLRSVLAKTARELNKASSDSGMSPTQASVLAMINARGPIGVSDLAELEGLNSTMLSRIVTKLASQGLVSRLPDRNDLRAVVLECTEKGTDVAKRIRALRTEALADCLNRLPDAEIKQIADALPALEALATELREGRAQRAMD